MNRRFAASLLAVVLLAIPAAAVAAPNHQAPLPGAATWWDALVAQVCLAVVPAAAPGRGSEPRSTNRGRGHGLMPTCSGGMDPNGHCLPSTRRGHRLTPSCSSGMDPDGRCHTSAGRDRRLIPTCSSNMDPNGHCL